MEVQTVVGVFRRCSKCMQGLIRHDPMYLFELLQKKKEKETVEILPQIERVLMVEVEKLDHRLQQQQKPAWKS